MRRDRQRGRSLLKTLVNSAMVRILLVVKAMKTVDENIQHDSDFAVESTATLFRGLILGTKSIMWRLCQHFQRAI